MPCVFVNADGSILHPDDPHTSFARTHERYSRLAGTARAFRAQPDCAVYIEIPKPDFCEVRSMHVAGRSGSDDNG
jgi:hypothetical protein